MLDYLPSLLAFAAAVLAIGGQTKTNVSERGLRRLTKAGWIALCLAVIALVASTAITRRTQQALEVQAHQRTFLRSVAHAQIRSSLRTITVWFFLLLGDNKVPDARFSLVPPHVFDSERIRTTLSFDIRQPIPHFLPATTWAELLKSSADRGSEQLTEALQIYAPYLDPETLALLSELRSSAFLVRIKSLDKYVSKNNDAKKLELWLVTSAHIEQSDYKRFWDIIARLDAVLDRNADLNHSITSEP